jgi:hypothetical protein
MNHYLDQHSFSYVTVIGNGTQLIYSSIGSGSATSRSLATGHSQIFTAIQTYKQQVLLLSVGVCYKNPDMFTIIIKIIHYTSNVKFLSPVIRCKISIVAARVNAPVS